MNIVGSKKKIAIIGKGTAGSLAISHFYKHFPGEIYWYYDPNTPTQTVGEGSTLDFCDALYFNSELKSYDLKLINGTPKLGIHKINWGGSGNFIHDFPLGRYGMHFDAVEFQKFIYNKFSSKVKVINQNIQSYDNIDVDYVIDCSGKSSLEKGFIEANSMVVNSAFVTQCYWGGPKFNNTLTIARPYGWVFGIPLQNRCSIGYLYNKDINSLEEVKKDIKNIFKSYNLTPSNHTKSLNFKSYYRKENFTNKVAYNGNASFFLEPLEATSIKTMNIINDIVSKIIINKLPLKEANHMYHYEFNSIQIMILLHYLAGSKFSTPFWDNAYIKAEKFLSKNISHPHFLNIYNTSKNLLSNNITHDTSNIPEFGQWGVTNYNINLKELNLYSKIDKLLNI